MWRDQVDKILDKPRSYLKGYRAAPSTDERRDLREQGRRGPGSLNSKPRLLSGGWAG